MLMQMLAAGGLPILSDAERQADEDNPLGYFEYDPVKRMMQNSAWLAEGKGKAVKIVAPLLASLPADVECRVIFIDRNLDEIVESQARMLVRRGEKIPDNPARRQRLLEEYTRLVVRVKNGLAKRPKTALLCLERNAVFQDPLEAACRINRFLGGKLDVALMAAQVKPELNRCSASQAAELKMAAP